jgi:hypothetical protein
MRLLLAALVDERVTQPHAGAQIKQVPLARSTPPVAVRPATTPAGAARGRDRTWGVSHCRAASWSPPAGRDGRPHRSPALSPRRARRPVVAYSATSRSSPRSGQGTDDAVAVRRRHPRAADFPRLCVQSVGRDLRSMLVESHYDCHLGPRHAPRLTTGTPCAPRLRRSGHTRQERSPAHGSFPVEASVAECKRRMLAWDDEQARVVETSETLAADEHRARWSAAASTTATAHVGRRAWVRRC